LAATQKRLADSQLPDKYYPRGNLALFLYLSFYINTLCRRSDMLATARPIKKKSPITTSLEFTIRVTPEDDTLPFIEKAL
jgi:hypothetical protein